MRPLNYNHLRYFWAVAHAGSLTKAAATLNLSQSALSAQLQKLEHQLGHPLFTREGRRLKLTEAGEMALEYADIAFAAGAELQALLAGQRVDRHRVFRVGALATLSRNFQMSFLQPLVERADVDLILRAGTLRELLAQLEAHELDVVLTNTTAPSEASPALQTHTLNTQRVSLVGHPRPDGTRFRFPEDLATTPVLLPSRESGIRIAFDTLMTKANIDPVILAEVDDMAMLRLLARAHDAVTLVPPIVVDDELNAGTLVELCQIGALTESFYAIAPRRRFGHPLLAELLAKK